MVLPPGVVDPLFLCELATELKMSVGEITHGRGTPMSAYELTILWPLFRQWKAKEAALAAADAEAAGNAPVPV